MSESKFQCDVVNLLDPLEQAGRLLYFAVPNGGKRNRREAAQLNNQGLRRGVPDLFVIMDEGIEGWELKTPDGKQSEDQKRWQAMLESFGIPYRLIRSIDDAKAVLRLV